MTHNLPAPEQENLRRRAESRDLRLLVDSLSELIGAGEPLDGMSRSRALGLLIGLERLLPPGHAGALLDKLRRTVQRGAPLIDDNGTGSELSARNSCSSSVNTGCVPCAAVLALPASLPDDIPLCPARRAPSWLLMER